MSLSTSRRKWWLTTICVAVACASGFTALVIACGPFAATLMTRQRSSPAYADAYDRGQLGVVRPSFQRRYLVQAYRVLAGRPVADKGAPAPRPTRADLQRNYVPSSWEQWRSLQTKILSGLTVPLPAPPIVDPERRTKDYASFGNCLDDAFTSAVRTLNARVARYGATSREVADWLAAQIAVFRNCSEADLVVPAAAPAWADATLSADREYQTAAAYFYATQYEEAARRFRAIAENRESPWRPLGRYLAARAMIRAATVPDEPADRTSIEQEMYATARRDLDAVLAEPGASAMHASARGLRDFVAARADPLARLRDLSRRLASPAIPVDQEIIDYTWLMDWLLEDATGSRADSARDEELTDWIIAMQRDSNRALAKWQDTRSLPWLVAALWSVPAQHESSAAILAAAAGVLRSSQAFSTVAILRVRLLMQRGARAEARILLGTLPTRTDATVNPEALNLLRAERLALAESLNELLGNAPRAAVGMDSDGAFQSLDPKESGSPVFDEDAAQVFNVRLPLDQLVESVESARLPARLRRRVAETAFVRAVVLRRFQAGLRVALVLKELAPTLRADLDRYITAATDDARHRAGILLLLRTPGMDVNVLGIETDVTYAERAPARQFDHLFKSNWWCGLAGPRETISELFGSQSSPFPSFVSAAERTAVEQERLNLSAAGAGRAYLAAQAISWANSVPTDAAAAEALAQAVEGWRWSYCIDEKPSALPRRAFQTLHRLFPASEWARRTKYWYQ
jgi:hypothetical protein